MEQSPHQVQIKVLNVAQNEVISYPLTLITGRVECTAVKCCSSAKYFQGQIRLTKSSSAPEESIFYPVLDGNFKGLVMLNEGENSLKVSYCNNSHQGELCLTIIHVPSKRKKIVKLIYLIPNEADADSSHIRSICDCIVLGARMMQTLVGERLKDHGLGRKSFEISPDCLVVSSRYSMHSAILR